MFEQFIAKLKEIHIPTGKYAVFGNGPIAVRGLIDTHDLDVIVTPKIYQEYKTVHQWKEKPCNNDFFI